VSRLWLENRKRNTSLFLFLFVEPGALLYSL